MKLPRLHSRSTTGILLLLLTMVASCADPLLMPRASARISAAGGDPTVTSTNPSAAAQDTTLTVSVFGTNFERGSTVALGLSGTPSSQVVTNSTRYINAGELRANITIAPDATVASYDVIVTMADGRKGIGTEIFAIAKNLKIATISTLSTLGSNSDALGIDASGTVAVGHSFDRKGYLYAVKWVLQNGSWVISKLPYTGSARAMAVNNQGDAVGYFASSPRHALLWPNAGGSTALSCAADVGATEALAITPSGQIAAGRGPDAGAVWRPGMCRENLPPLVQGGYSVAYAINDDATIVGGSAAVAPGDVGGYVPVRWRWLAGTWTIEMLDSRAGRVGGANAAGDLVGWVKVPCALAEGCDRGMIWYASGESRELGVLGGDHIWPSDINNNGEVVGRGSSTSGGLGWFWSESIGMYQLPAKASGAGAWGVSDVRADGTRAVAGGTGAAPYIWIVRNP